MMKILLFAIIMIAAGIVACKLQSSKNDVTVDVTSGTQGNDTLADGSLLNDRIKYLISNRRAGQFMIGGELPGPATMMTYKMRKEQLTRQTEDGPATEPVTIISDDDEDLLWLKPGLKAGSTEYNSTIQEIIVQSGKYTTSKNIGVGSTISDFLAAYPETKIWYTYVSEMYVMEAPALKAQFILDKNDYTGKKPEIKSEQTILNISDFRKESTIQKVRII